MNPSWPLAVHLNPDRHRQEAGFPIRERSFRRSVHDGHASSGRGWYAARVDIQGSFPLRHELGLDRCVQLNHMLRYLLGAERPLRRGVNARPHLIARGSFAAVGEHEMHAHQAVVEDVARQVEAPSHVVLYGLAEIVRNAARARLPCPIDPRPPLRALAGSRRQARAVPRPEPPPVQRSARPRTSGPRLLGRAGRRFPLCAGPWRSR